MSTVHELKAWPEFFGAVIDESKPFEVRRADRPFAVGDVLHLREWSEATGYTGRAAVRRVAYILPAHPGLVPGFVCLGLHGVWRDRGASADRRYTLAELRPLLDAISDEYGWGDVFEVLQARLR